MLNSCAPGVTVVNIDNGYGAGVAAARICRIGHPVPGDRSSAVEEARQRRHVTPDEAAQQ